MDAGASTSGQQLQDEEPVAAKRLCSVSVSQSPRESRDQLENPKSFRKPTHSSWALLRLQVLAASSWSGSESALSLPPESDSNTQTSPGRLRLTWS